MWKLISNGFLKFQMNLIILHSVTNDVVPSMLKMKLIEITIPFVRKYFPSIKSKNIFIFDFYRDGKYYYLILSLERVIFSFDSIFERMLKDWSPPPHLLQTQQKGDGNFLLLSSVWKKKKEKKGKRRATFVFCSPRV